MIDSLAAAWWGPAAAVPVVCWWLWPYALRGEYRREWRGAVQGQWADGSGRGLRVVRRPGFTTEIPSRVPRLPTFGLLNGYDPTNEFRFREHPAGFGGAFSAPVPSTVVQRRRWQSTARRYVKEINDAETVLLNEYARTIGALSALLPGGRRRLTRKRADVVARYETTAEQAAGRYRPVHDRLAPVHDRWWRQVTRLREKDRQEHARQRRLGQELANQAVWGYEITKRGERLEVRVFRTGRRRRPPTQHAERSRSNLTAKQLADELVPVWNGEKPSSLIWEKGARASVERATGMYFSDWWKLATGYRLLEGYELDRHRNRRHHHMPYHGSYGSFGSF